MREMEVDGIRFYETKQGYFLGSVNGRAKRLHIYVWEKYNGAIPKGYHVHHIDGNKSNNDISNLELMKAHEHISLHSSTPENRAAARENMKTVMKYAIAWHKSKAGREWHREHAKSQLAVQLGKKIKLTCGFCGKEYETPAFCRNRSRFCSENCKQAARRHSGVDDSKRLCRACGAEYYTNKYAPKLYCTDDCRRAWHESQKGV